MLQGLQEGRIVHYVYSSGDLDDQHQHLEHRAAIVVNAWASLGRDDGYANLTVFMDGRNDSVDGQGSSIGPLLHVTSRVYSDEKEPGTWHWPER